MISFCQTAVGARRSVCKSGCTTMIPKLRRATRACLLNMFSSKTTNTSHDQRYDQRYDHLGKVLIILSRSHFS